MKKPSAATGLILLCLLSACTRQLVTTPNLYVGGSDRGDFNDVAPEYQNNRVDVLYATDRVAETARDGGLAYGHRRSKVLVFGSCVVQFGDDVGWDELVANIDVIRADVDSSFIGHSYFLDNPAVSSDLILLLRDGRSAGPEHGRPLENVDYSFWVVKEGYPY